MNRKDFVEYVDICFKEFGDRVKEWITINEPNMFAVLGYNVGNIAPGRCSSYVQNCTVGNSATEPYLVAHYLILSHAATVQLYREKYQVLFFIIFYKIFNLSLRSQFS